MTRFCVQVLLWNYYCWLAFMPMLLIYLMIQLIFMGILHGIYEAWVYMNDFDFDLNFSKAHYHRQPYLLQT